MKIDSNVFIEELDKIPEDVSNIVDMNAYQGVYVNFPEELLDEDITSIISKIHLTEEDKEYKISAKIKYHVVNKLSEVMGLILNNEMALMVINQPKYKLTIACAGAGKTTATYLEIAYLKTMDLIYQAMADAEGKERKRLFGGNIKFLVFNTHNVDPVVRLHNRYMDLINMSNILLKLRGVNIPVHLDHGLSVSTFHSEARARALDYERELGIMDYHLVQDDRAYEKLMSTSAEKFVDAKDLKYYRPEDLYGMYITMKEGLIDYKNMPEDVVIKIPKLAKTKWDLDVLVKVFTGFERLKDRRKYLNFTDYLCLFHTLLSSDRYEQAKLRAQGRYDIYIVDEYQDFNDVMIECMKILTEDKRMVSIGDDDQAIYGFRGVDVKNFLNFRNIYATGNEEDVHIYRMSINRRCGDAIVQAADYIVKQNVLRYPKSVRGLHEGGELHFTGYSTQVGQAVSIARRLSLMKPEDRDSVIICYKNNQQSEILGYELDRLGIKYHIGNGRYPLNNFIFNSFYNCIQMVLFPNDRYYRKNIHMVTKIPMDVAFNLVGWNNYKKEYGREQKQLENIHFIDEDYGFYNNDEVLQEELFNLSEVSKALNSSLPMKEYIDYLIEQFIRHSVNWRADADDADEEYFDYFSNALRTYFSSDLTWREFYKEHNFKIEMNRSASEHNTGPLLSTFHGLKGLEADTVIVTGMDEEIYPAIAKIQEQEYPIEVETLMIEEERRLFYVLVTRARNKIYFYYNENNPSSFVVDLIQREQELKSVKE